MDFVYICKEGENEELRYSIRSVLHHFPTANIWVVGGKATWYTGNYIEVPQKMTKYRNALNNLNHILKSNDISKDFVLMNDDFYIMSNITNIPVFHGGSLSKKIELYESLVPMSGYTAKLKMTYKKIQEYGIEDPLDYELHLPFNINKDLLLPIISNNNPKLLWRSVYGNINNIEGELTKDVKVYSVGPLVAKSYQYKEGDIFLSTQDNAFQDTVQYILQDKFPKQSHLEMV